MNLVQYSIPEFRNKQNIKALLEKLGVPQEVWDNNGQNFWNQSKEELRRAFEIAGKIYKRLAIQVHPRALTDSDEEAKKLHALWTAIEKRFDFKLNKAVILKDFNAGKIECACGCGKLFFPIAPKGACNDKIYFNKQCQERAKSQRAKEKRARNRRIFYLDNLPLVSCRCGCGIRFRQTKNRCGPKVYATRQCKHKHRRQMIREGLVPQPPSHTRAGRLKYHLKTLKSRTKICACGCGQVFEDKSQFNNLKFRDKECCKKAYNFKRKMETRRRHENFLKILNGETINE